MNDQLQQRVVQIMDYIQKTVTQAQDFVLAQAPDIVQSYVLYGRVMFAIQTLLVLVLGLVWVVIVRKGVITRAFDANEETPVAMFSSAALAAMTLFFMTLYISDFSNGVLCFVAPKVWLIKEIAEIVR